LGAQLQVYSEVEMFAERQIFSEMGFEQIGEKAGAWQASFEGSGFQ